MQPSNEMLVKLREHVRRTEGVPSEETALSPGARLAFVLGKVYGKAELAKEILEDFARGE